MTDFHGDEVKKLKWRTQKYWDFQLPLFSIFFMIGPWVSTMNWWKRHQRGPRLNLYGRQAVQCKLKKVLKTWKMHQFCTHLSSKVKHCEVCAHICYTVYLSILIWVNDDLLLIWSVAFFFRSRSWHQEYYVIPTIFFLERRIYNPSQGPLLLDDLLGAKMTSLLKIKNFFKILF